MAEGGATGAVQEKGRPLSPTEVMNHHYIEGSNIGIYYHAAVINTSQPLKDDDVIAACKILVRSQEALQMRIVPTDPERKTLDFEYKPMEDLEKIDFEAITMKTKDAWPECVSREQDNNKIDCVNGPLWKMILGRVERPDTESSVEDVGDMPHQYVILIKIHHSIADGKSVFDMLYRQFLPVLSTIINGGDAENVVPFVPHAKSVEEVLMTKKQRDSPVPWYINLGLNVLRWKNRKFGIKERPLYKFSDEEVPSVDHIKNENPCFPVVFEEDISGAVVKSAKKNGVTVHSVLLAADAVAFCRTADAAGVKLPGSFKQGWPIDLRKYVNYESPQPLADMHGIGMSDNKRATEPRMEEFWKSVKKLYAGVKKQSSRENGTKFMGLLKYFVDNAAKTPLVELMKEMGMSMHLSISNLGNTSAGPEPKMAEGDMKFRLVEHFFTLTGFWKLDAAPISQFMLSYDGRMMWVVTYAPQRTSLGFVKKYIENLKEVLKAYCMTDDQSNATEAK